MRLFSSVLPLFIIFIIARLEETRDQTAGKENLFLNLLIRFMLMLAVENMQQQLG
jgi:hypothetical protein